MKNNETMLQSFEWYTADDGSFWKQMEVSAPSFSSLGFTMIWLPPACKAQGGSHDVGYGIYDLYDLGEFDQKGTVRTKYGTRQEYLRAVRALQDCGLSVISDIVLNQKMGADEMEEICSVESDGGDRNRNTGRPVTIRAWTKFTFPGRKGKYDDFIWDHTCFDGTDYDAMTGKGGIYRFCGKQWDSGVDSENGNFDYLMGCDLDMNSAAVRAQLLKWGRWYLDTTGTDGFRLDAVKHISSSFYLEWIRRMREHAGRRLFVVGEYWNGDPERLLRYLEDTHGEMALFDVPLHFRFFDAGNASGTFDMRTIFDGTVLQRKPEMAVTFVDNHDTQPSQALSSFVASWFKSLAYALILLRKNGIPCVFSGDLYGIPHDGVLPVASLPLLLRLRRNYAYGDEMVWAEDPDVIGWIRTGDAEHPGSGLAVVMSDGPGGEVKMRFPLSWAGKTLRDVMGVCGENAVIGGDGSVSLRCGGGSVSVWVAAEEAERLKDMR